MNTRRTITLLFGLALLACNADFMPSDLPGSWGGPHALLILNPTGGTMEYDCASGTVSSGWTVTPDGFFSASGGYLAGHGGPIAFDEDTTSRPVHYQGTIRGKVMTLTVVLTDSNSVLGTYLLTQGSGGSVFKCL